MNDPKEVNEALKGKSVKELLQIWANGHNPVLTAWEQSKVKDKLIEMTPFAWLLGESYGHSWR